LVSGFDYTRFIRELWQYQSFTGNIHKMILNKLDLDKLQGFIRRPSAFYFSKQMGFGGSIQTLAMQQTHCNPF
jgi:hypothetical protein